MMIDVRARYLTWFNSDGDDILGTGTTIDVFHMVVISPDCCNRAEMRDLTQLHTL